MGPLINDEEALRRHEEKQKQQSTLQKLIAQPNLPDPSVSVPDKIDPAPATQAMQYNNNQAMLDDFITRPVTQQDAERRQRAATAVGAVGQLGNMISAFANLAGTAGGAAPQQISGYQGPDVQSWQDRTRQRQLEYAQIMNGLSAQDWEQEYKNRQLARQERLDAQAQANADRDFGLRQDDLNYKRNYTTQRDAIEDQMKAAAQQEAARHNRVTEGISQQNANTSEERVAAQIKDRETKVYRSMGLNPDGSHITRPVKDGDGNFYNLDESALYYKFGSGNNGTKGSATLAQLYDILPEDVKQKYSLNSWQDLSKNAAAASDALAIAMKKDKNLVKEMMGYGILTPTKVTPLSDAQNSGKKDIDYTSPGGWNSIINK